MSAEPISLLIIGGAGRMGSKILDVAAEETGYTVEAVFDRRRPEGRMTESARFFTDLDEALRSSPGAVVVDVSGPERAGERITAVAREGHPLVEGTTGLQADRELSEAARTVAVVVAPNFSPGIALLRRALREILSARTPRWDTAVLDRHHRFKKDRPSGTALLLEREIERARSGRAGESRQFDPTKHSESDRSCEVASFRQGGQVGEHTVYMTTLAEELVFQHRAFDRGAFARGALLAARFASAAVAGLYGMDEVLGFGG